MQIEDYSVVKTAKGDKQANEMIDKGWKVIGEAHFVQYQDESGQYHWPLAWPKSSGEHPPLYED